MCCAAFIPYTIKAMKEKGMKPYTKLQRKCMELQERLPKLTEAQEKWIWRQEFKTGDYLLRGRGGKHSGVWCHVCGQFDEIGSEKVFKHDKTRGQHRCSCCGKKIEVRQRGYVDSWQRLKKQTNMRVGFITTCGGMQVVRVFNLYREVAPMRKIEERIDEVFTVWYDVDKDKEVVISKPYTYNFYNSYWSLDEPMKVARKRRTLSYGGNDTYDLAYDTFYPRTKVLPVLKRNGWSNKLTKVKNSPIRIWKALLHEPIAEGLVKQGQLAIFDYLLDTGMEDWRHGGGYRLALVKICTRHGYIIKDARMWNDVIGMLEELGMDKRSPKYICPDSLKAMHDWLMDKTARLRAKKKKEEQRRENRIWEKKYAEDKARYLPITFDNGVVFCHVIQSVEEMLEEGECMHHCVYDAGYYKRPESLILSARDKAGKRLETVEVNLKTYKVVQSRALQNGRTSLHEDIVSLVEKNMSLVRNAERREIKKK